MADDTKKLTEDSQLAGLAGLQNTEPTQQVEEVSGVQNEPVQEPQDAGEVINEETQAIDEAVEASEDSDDSGADQVDANQAEADGPLDQEEAKEGDDNSDKADEEEVVEAEEKTQEDDEDEASEGSSSDPASQEDDDIQPVEEPKQTPGRWYVVHTFAGHENRVAATLKQRIEAEHLENKIFDILVPTQDKIEIRGGKKETVKEKIFPGYILVKMELDDVSWLAVRTTQGVTSFVGAANKPTPISDKEVATIVKFTQQGAAPTFKDVFMLDDTVKITDGPFSDFIGKVDSVDKEKGKVRVLVSIFGRETPVELDFLQVQKL